MRKNTMPKPFTMLSKCNKTHQDRLLYRCHSKHSKACKTLRCSVFYALFANDNLPPAVRIITY